MVEITYNDIIEKCNPKVMTKEYMATYIGVYYWVAFIFTRIMGARTRRLLFMCTVPERMVA